MTITKFNKIKKIPTDMILIMKSDSATNHWNLAKGCQYVAFLNCVSSFHSCDCSFHSPNQQCCQSVFLPSRIHPFLFCKEFDSVTLQSLDLYKVAILPLRKTWERVAVGSIVISWGNRAHSWVELNQLIHAVNNAEIPRIYLSSWRGKSGHLPSIISAGALPISLRKSLHSMLYSIISNTDVTTFVCSI